MGPCEEGILRYYPWFLVEGAGDVMSAWTADERNGASGQEIRPALPKDANLPRARSSSFLSQSLREPPAAAFADARWVVTWKLRRAKKT